MAQFLRQSSKLYKVFDQSTNIQEFLQMKT